MNNLLQLSGEVMESDSGRIAELEAENDALRSEVLSLQRQVTDAKRDSARAVAKLRQVLTPLFQSMKILFGEMDAVGSESAPSGVGGDARLEAWKKRFPGRAAEMIELLELNGPMTITNFITALKCGKNTAYQLVSKLGQAGVIVNNGGRYSLKS